MFLVGFVTGVCVLGAGLWLYGQYLAKKQAEASAIPKAQAVGFGEANGEKGGDK